jgi:hypothetical protein
MIAYDECEQGDRGRALDIVMERTEPFRRETAYFSTEGLRVSAIIGRDSVIDRALAARLVATSSSTVLSSVWQRNVAEEPMIKGRMRWGDDLDESPCVYIFVSLRHGLVLKVGTTNDSRDRIAKKHLRYGTDDSTLRGYLRAYREWPRVIEDDQIVLLVFPMKGYEKEERLAVERGLDELLDPVISARARRRRATNRYRGK